MLAKRMIESGKFQASSHEAVYDAYMLAYQDKDIAAEAQTRWLEKHVQQSCDSAAKRTA